MDTKRVLVIGSGGREHALAWKLSRSPKVAQVYCAPGNAGIEQHARCVPVSVSDVDGLVALAKREKIDLTVVGPEAPLADGLVDRFVSEGLRVFGPSQSAALIEASKVFAKEVMTRAGVPTGGYRVFTEAEPALDFLATGVAFPVVLKAEGLAAGKGVIIAHTLEEATEAVKLILQDRAFGDAGGRLVIEEFLDGEEASFMAVTDGATILPLATSQDHKAAFDGDQGPNTGGMGAYSPAPVVDSALFDQVMRHVMEPTVATLSKDGHAYHGVLYGGLMIKNGQAKVLEFNCRFGDPEAQPILMRLRTDLMEIFEAAVDERLQDVKLEWDPRPAVCVVLASGGYPGAYEKGRVIHGLDDVEGMKDVMVFHAGTARKDGQFVTAGGRVLGVTALGDSIGEAIERAYEAVGKISWEGMHYRKDIGQKALKHSGGGGAASEGPVVGIVMGSVSDKAIMEEARKILKDFDVPCELKVASAHRSPALAAAYAEGARARGLKVLIAGAGMAAHLAGALAAHTTLPIIGVPVDASPLNGLDALLATVQMPPGVPVATMAIGKAGARNAAILAVQMLALGDARLAKRLEDYKRQQAEKVEALNRDL